ncbi:hypothetical protein [Aestuariibaculum suncheonense]|uniref:Uncharacterized protein n=1 Tax=Aestuariibaculum suncheonense TaxID=1028745 RepID=A0A8J6UI75_9FLAO|nr:hypothetical protein [Aestuariibaculum suncheonense]MBD0836294.1 hypothetical protein [Aestuariibaculum suncheonense]
MIEYKRWFYKGLVGLIVAIIQFGCSNDESTNEGVSVFWEQTGCADPWGTGANDTEAETTNALKLFLAGEDISVFKVNVEITSTAQDCFACSCLTGKTITVNVAESDVAKMEELGFYLK